MKHFKILLLVGALLLPLAAQAAGTAPMGGANQPIGDEALEPKKPMMAVVFAVMPGLLFHGSGNFYAGDNEFGTKMLVMQILGSGLALWGHNMIHQPNNWGQYFGGDTQQAGYWIKAAGVGMMALSWVGDVATASEAAESWNKDHALQFQMDTYQGTGVRLALGTRF